MNKGLITDTQLESNPIKNTAIGIEICKSYDDFLALKAKFVVEVHFADVGFNVNKFAEYMAMSQSTLYRKSRSLLSLSPNEYIQHVRLEHAERLLKQKTANVTTIAFAVGFSDPKYFARCFKLRYGFNPSDILRL